MDYLLSRIWPESIRNTVGRRPKDGAGLSRNDADEEERLDLELLKVRATDSKGVEVNSLHLSGGSFFTRKVPCD